MTPDAKGYCDRFDKQDHPVPEQAAREHLAKQQLKGFMKGHFVMVRLVQSPKDKLMTEAADRLSRANARIEELEKALVDAEGIQFCEACCGDGLCDNCDGCGDVRDGRVCQLCKGTGFCAECHGFGPVIDLEDD